MLKKGLLFGLICALTTSIYSNVPGLYIGIAAGVDTANYKQHAHITRPGEFNALNETYLAAQGAMGTFFIGYGRHYRNCYLGVEATGSINDAWFRSYNIELRRNAQAHTLMQIDHDWTIGLLPGYMLTDTFMIYGRGSYASGRFFVRTTDNSLASLTEMLDAIRLGIGLEKALTEHARIRMEYSHYNYANRTDSVFDPVGNVTKLTVTTPNTNQFELGLDYLFT